MNKVLLAFLFLPLLSLASPEWMFKIKHEKTQIIGYGVGSTLREAKQSAMYDIINFISVNIKSDLAISSSDVNGKASNSSSSNLSTSSQAQLSGIEFIKTLQEGNLWYVGAVYDNSPFEVKFERLIGPQTKDEVQNTYLKNTSLICALNNEMQATLNYSIIRQNNLWQLKYDNYILALKQKDFYKLFSTQYSKNIHLSANKEVYKEKDTMYFNIQHKNSGFISILYVEHNGKVGVLLKNHPSQHNFKYPDVKDEEIFKISNPYKKTIYELYVAIYSKSSLNLQEFENIDDSYLDESSYNFDKLIKILDKKSFSTYTIKIK